MLPEIKIAYQNGRMMLLLGAGASYGSRGFDGNEMPMGDDLAKELAALKGWSYKCPSMNILSPLNPL
jgi:hypothetical protein